jgi:hypothetical protein
MRDRFCKDACVDEAGGGIGCVETVVWIRLEEGQLV